MASIFTQYGRVVDLLPELIFIIDDDLRILDRNKSAAEECGLGDISPGQLSILTLLPEDQQESFTKLIQWGDRARPTESKLMKGDRSVIDVELEVRTLRSGKEACTVVIGRDITEAKRKDLDLLRFSNVIHYTINPIQITDTKGMMVYVNPAFEEASGYSREELIGKNPRIFSSGKHGKEFWAGVWKSILSGKVWVGRLENLRKDGSPFFTELVISPIIDRKGGVAGFLGAHRDITEQKLLEQQLVRSQKMESIGTLAAGIAHEVGNPLTAISSLVQVIQRTSRDEFAKEKLELINSQINRIARIIRDLVDFSRPSTQVTKPTDMNRLLKDALNIVQYGKRVKDITFSIGLKPELPAIQVVPDQVVQVFINILMNAVDALEGHPGMIAVQSRMNNSTLEVEVRDSGKGIEPADVEKIFEPFYTTKAVGQGTGLGLWVSYGIVKSFGGDISVESEPGKGSKFVVMFPIKGE